MLSEGQRRLLTAYVDGELSAAQQRQVKSLVQSSREARRLLELLERDAAALRSMPTPALDRDLADSILDVLGRQQSIPISRPFRRPGASYTARAGAMAAAATLLLFGGGAYLYYSFALRPAQENLAIAKTTKGTKPLNASSIDKVPAHAADETSSGGHPATESSAKSAGPTGPKVATTEKPEKPASPAKEEPAPQPDVIAAPSMEKLELKTATLQVPIVLRLRELAEEPAASRLVEELAKDSIFRIELPCRNASLALDRVQMAWRKQHFTILLDPSTQRRLLQPKLKTHYALFAEDVTPEEVARMLRLIDAEDLRVASQRTSETYFDRVVISRVPVAERKSLAELLGFDPTRRPSGQMPDVRPGQGGRHPEPGTASRSALDELALVVAFSNSPRPRSPSREAKLFQEMRRPARPGTLQIFLVVRHTGT